MRLLSVATAVDDGAHNAVTDLAWWRGRYWLAYRRAESHFNRPPGELRVLASDDLERWELAAVVSTPLDDRDPKLLADGERLWLTFGAARLQGGRRWTESHATWTTDGRTFAEPVRTYGPGWWLWRPLRFDDGFWCLAYGCDALTDPGKQYVDLVRSDDGLRWERVTRLLGDLRGNEGTLQRDGDVLRAFVRGRADRSFVLEARPPYTRWAGGTLPHWMHAPAVCEAGGRTLVAGRDRRPDGTYATRLWEWRRTGAPGGATTPLLELPSGGDTSYCGLVARDGELAVSWYSQHAYQDRPGFRPCHGPAAVYVARVALDAPASRAA